VPGVQGGVRGDDLPAVFVFDEVLPVRVPEFGRIPPALLLRRLRGRSSLLGSLLARLPPLVHFPVGEVVAGDGQDRLVLANLVLERLLPLNGLDDAGSDLGVRFPRENRDLLKGVPGRDAVCRSHLRGRILRRSRLEFGTRFDGLALRRCFD